jgi:transposase
LPVGRGGSVGSEPFRPHATAELGHAPFDQPQVGHVHVLIRFEGRHGIRHAGYDELFRSSHGAVSEVGCWAHARRKFVEAEKTSPREAHEAVARVRQLYAVEDEARSLDAPARAALRQTKATKVLDALKTWLDREQARALPRTPLADALTYAMNQWAALTVYVTDGDLAIDNNAAERAIKPFAIGRKNWLFFGSDRGGRTLATLCSLTATCELRGVNPWVYLKDTLTRLPTTPPDQLATLLPAATT